jgi:ketosteroid isomerase-like protein
MPESHKEILQKANAAIVKGDYEGFLKFCTEDTEWTFVGDKTLKGKDAVREWMANEYREPPRFEVHQLIAEGDFVAALGEITLKDDAGKDVRHAYCDVWRFRGGRMIELRAFVVEAEMEGAAGESGAL